MRSFLLPILAFLASAAPASALAQAAPAGECAVSVRFGSYAMGIDGPAFERVRALLARDRDVRAVDEQLPAKPRGPITVETRGGLRFEAPRQRNG